MEGYRILRTHEDFRAAGSDLRRAVVQGMDLSEHEADWDALQVQGAVFLGVKFARPETAVLLVQKGAVLFPPFENRPYNPYRAHLYTAKELVEGWDAENGRSLDQSIFDHYQRSRRAPDLLEALAQRIHDHAIDDALERVLRGDAFAGRRKVVGIMGGHGVRRDDEFYRRTVHLGRLLARAGYFVATGGGPGVMEAGNLGAYLSRVSDFEVDQAVAELAKICDFHDPRYTASALEVVRRHPMGSESLSVPTWFYGHEPVNVFASHVAKYFSNSIREDGLLAIALHGIVYAPGGFGTLQEIFQDLAQNHYRSYNCYSPMVFFGRSRYCEQTMIYPMLSDLVKDKPYKDLITVLDDPHEVLEFLLAHPPVACEVSSGP